jgi:CheY-like chemotaxis protein
MAKVLIVDDEASQRGILSKILKADGYEVFEAADVTQAERELREKQPDVVLTDLKMPGKGGLELMEQISRRPLPLRLWS